MDLIVIESEPSVMKALRDLIWEAAPGCQVHGFADEQDAILYLMEQPADAVILGKQAGSGSGIKTARILRNIWKDLDIILCADDGRDAAEAYVLHCSGYIIRPVTADRMRDEIYYLRGRRQVTPEALSTGDEADDDALRIATFGNFEVFFHGRPLPFKYNKTRELLAYLVDRRGAMCTKREISAVLWQDDDGRKHMSYFSNLRNDLISTLENIGKGDVILRKRGMMGINIPAVRCDLFSCLYTLKARSGSRVSAGEVAYRGEYMKQYSWAEETNSVLSQMLSGGYLAESLM